MLPNKLQSIGKSSISCEVDNVYLSNLSKIFKILSLGLENCRFFFSFGFSFGTFGLGNKFKY